MQIQQIIIPYQNEGFKMDSSLKDINEITQKLCTPYLRNYCTKFLEIPH